MSVIDTYLESVSLPQRAELERIRRITKQLIPDAEDTIGYGMPVLKYKGKYLIGFASFKHHISIFPGAEPVETLKPKLSGFKLSKGTVQFTLDNPISDELLREIITVCQSRIGIAP